MHSRSSSLGRHVSEEAKQTLEFVNQVEPLIASGSHGRLDEYISAVDLLFNAKSLFEKTEFEQGYRHTVSLISTAIDDLEFEFKDMLHRRSQQLVSKMTKEHLKDVRKDNSSQDDLYGEESIERALSVSSSSASGAEAAPELLPPSVVRWLNQIARRMQLGGQAARCAEVYRVERAAFLDASLQSLKTELLSSLSLENMPWETMEKTCREWMIQINIMVHVLMVGEYDLCSRILGIPDHQQNRVFTDLVRGNLLTVLQGLLRVGRDMATKRFPEQLFAMLDLFDTVQEIQPEVRRVLSVSATGDLLVEFETLPRLTAEAVMATFDQLCIMMQDIPVPGDVNNNRRVISFFRGQQPSNDDTYELVPRGGVVHPITSYIVNYVRGYLHRLGKRNYVSILEKVFSEYGNNVESGQELDPPVPRMTRSVDRETGRLVLILRRSLDARAKLYRDEVLQQLFLLNNINYIYRSMLLWHGWHGRGLQKAISSAQRDGDSELLKGLMELQDDHIVTSFITAFQQAALSKIFAILGDPTADSKNSRSRAKVGESASEMKTRLKKFNAAFDELCIRQEEWLIPDDELRLRIRSQWVNVIRERYRKLLLPFWEELSESKYFVYKPEDIEIRVLSFFNQSTN